MSSSLIHPSTTIQNVRDDITNLHQVLQFNTYSPEISKILKIVPGLKQNIDIRHNVYPQEGSNRGLITTKYKAKC